MSDYTPTTEEVRQQYVFSDSVIDGTSFEDPAQGEAEFDRWLAEHDRQVKAEAWDEGRDAGWDDGLVYGLSMYGEHRTDNPYREETE